MKMPYSGTSARRLVRVHGVYLKARLEAHPGVEDLAARWRGVCDAVMTATNDAELASERQVIAKAAMNFADMTLDNAVRQVAAAAKADLGGRTNDLDFGKLFRKLPSDVVALPPAEKVEEVRLIETKIPNGPRWNATKSAMPTLSAARKGLEEARARLSDARRESSSSRENQAEAVGIWKRSYRAIFGALTERFPGDPALVESFFWRDNGRKEEEVEPAQPKDAEPAVGGA